MALIAVHFFPGTDLDVPAAAKPRSVPTPSGAAVARQNSTTTLAAGRPDSTVERHDYIVQASTIGLAIGAVARVGGQVTGELNIIRAVGASLDASQLDALRAQSIAGLRVYEDAPVGASAAAGQQEETAPPSAGPIGSPKHAPPPPGPPQPDGVLSTTYYPAEVDAQNLQLGGVTGQGVTVAVLDSGLWKAEGPLQYNALGTARVLAQYDVLLADAEPTKSQAPYQRDIDDPFGHGTHVSAIIGSAGVDTSGNYQGVAPGVNLVEVRVLDANGKGRYFDVIKGIQWVLQNAGQYNIRVINLSLGAVPQSPYWEDPLDQAVMVAWQAGIVVVAAAGNRGPGPMTIDVPGNNPYVITVGAVTDAYHPMQRDLYQLATFSSAGPTREGFVKPDVVAMGGHILAYAPDDGTLAREFPGWVGPNDDFTMSGTSKLPLSPVEWWR